MKCPNCKADQCGCINSRQHDNYRLRRYVCDNCGTRFSTRELVYNYSQQKRGKKPVENLASILEKVYNTTGYTDEFLNLIALEEAQEWLSKTNVDQDRRAHAYAYLALSRLKSKGEIK